MAERFFIIINNEKLMHLCATVIMLLMFIFKFSTSKVDKCNSENLGSSKSLKNTKCPYCSLLKAIVTAVKCQELDSGSCPS